MAKHGRNSAEITRLRCETDCPQCAAHYKRIAGNKVLLPDRSHPRCTDCGICYGPGHLTRTVVAGGEGEFWCGWCAYFRARRNGRRVAQSEGDLPMDEEKDLGDGGLGSGDWMDIDG